MLGGRPNAAKRRPSLDRWSDATDSLGTATRLLSRKRGLKEGGMCVGGIP